MITTFLNGWLNPILRRFHRPRRCQHGQRRPCRPQVEALEDRLAPATGLHALMQFSGDIAIPRERDDIAVAVRAEDFSLRGGRVLLGLALESTGSDTLDPGRLQVRATSRARAQVELQRTDVAADHSSMALVSVRPGSFSVIAHGQKGTAGSYVLNVYLAGDVNGDNEVNRQDLLRITTARGQRQGDAGYVAAADVDCNGVINTRDVRLAQRNLGVSTRLTTGGPRVTPTLDSAHAASLVVGIQGGTVRTTDVAGLNYTLEIPSGALLDAATITLTPVSAIPNLPLSGGLVAAVDFSPDGLQFFRPATLTIDVPGGIDSRQLVGFSYEGNGQDFHLRTVQIDGSRLTFQVTHFSGVGAAFAAPADIAALRAQSWSQAEAQFWNRLTLLDPSDAESYEDIFREWYNTSVRPRLAAGAVGDVELRAGLREFLSWHDLVRDLSPVVGVDFRVTFAAQIQQGNGLAATGLRNAITRANDRCRTQQNLAGAEDALRWQAIAESVGLATTVNQLDLNTVRAGLCRIEALYGSLLFPDQLQQGQPADLGLQVGVSIEGGATQFNRRFRVEVTPAGTVEGFTTGVSDNQGIFTTTFRPAGSQELQLRIRACLDDPTFPRVSRLMVCQEAIVVRGDSTIQGNVTVTNETELAALANVREIIGNLTIQGTTLNDVASLSRLRRVGGDLRVVSNSVLLDLNGLRGLESVGGTLQIAFNPLLADLAPLGTLRSVGGILSLDGPALTSLGGLSNLTRVGGLVISGTGLTNLDGLQGIAGTLSRNLRISSNAALRNIDTLRGITRVEGTVEIYQNAVLDNVNGLSGLTHIGGNPSEVSRFSGPALANVNGLLNLTTVASTLSIATPEYGALGSFVLPALTTIEGDLHIEAGSRGVFSSGSLNLISLTALTSVGRPGSTHRLRIDGGPGGSVVVQLPALANVSFGVHVASGSLTRLELGPLTTGSIGDVFIRLNATLATLTMAGPVNLGRDLFIADNPRLSQLTIGALTVARDFEITNNDALTSPGGIASGTIGRDLDIFDNAGFTNDQARALGSRMTIGRDVHVGRNG